MSDLTGSNAKWHEHYDDPHDDTVLITTDNIKFRVSSRLLEKHSIITQSSMPASHDQHDKVEDVNPSGFPLEPIRIDATSVLLELFLGILARATREYIFNGISFEQSRDPLGFAERYGCQDLIPGIRAALVSKTVLAGQPTALFILASDRDDWKLGRAAMRLMNPVEVATLFGVPPPPAPPKKTATANMEKVHGFFDSLRLEWRLILMPLLLLGTCSSFGLKLMNVEWKELADDSVEPGTSPKRKAGDEAMSTSKKVRRE